VRGLLDPLEEVDVPAVGDIRVGTFGALDAAAGEAGDGIADAGVFALNGAAAYPADAAVAGQAVSVVAPVPEPPGDVAAEHLGPPRLEPLPAQPDAGNEPDPCRLAQTEQPPGQPRFLDVHGSRSNSRRDAPPDMLHRSCTRPKPPNRVAARLGVELTERSGVAVRPSSGCPRTSRCSRPAASRDRTTCCSVRRRPPLTGAQMRSTLVRHA
jgi:hypothetical protein